MKNIAEQFINQFKKDGEDHIQVGIHSGTKLGKMLSLSYLKRFEVPGCGEFMAPICFLNWLVSGDEESRFDPRIRVLGSVKYYRLLLIYGKFYQMCSMQGELKSLNRGLPIVAYETLPTGLKQTTTKFESPKHVAGMLRYLSQLNGVPAVDRDGDWDWEEYGVDLDKIVNDHIQEIVETGKGKHKLKKPNTPRKKSKGKFKKKSEAKKPSKNDITEEIKSTPVIHDEAPAIEFNEDIDQELVNDIVSDVLNELDKPEEWVVWR